MVDADKTGLIKLAEDVVPGQAGDFFHSTKRAGIIGKINPIVAKVKINSRGAKALRRDG